jgi:hypothetical protein
MTIAAGILLKPFQLYLAYQPASFDVPINRIGVPRLDLAEENAKHDLSTRYEANVRHEANG